MHDFPIIDQIDLLRDSGDGSSMAFILVTVLLIVLTPAMIAIIRRRDP